MKIILGLALLVLLNNADGKVFTKCELARELLNNGMTRSALRDWVCLVQHASGMDTSFTRGPNDQGFKDWGVFQINDQYWCRPGASGGVCQVDCRNFLDDSIADDCRCAQIIFGEHGFSAWDPWTHYCQYPGDLPDLSDCNL